jgi:glycerophosphoryl diester phosphodiesterase
MKAKSCIFMLLYFLPQMTFAEEFSLGVRPYYLIENMDDGVLKDELQKCIGKPIQKQTFSIGHRGAAAQFPEHTKESYLAAARMGAGIIECDVTFTKDKELVCRHSQNDLHTTTNVLAHPDLVKKCTIPFVPANPETGETAKVECRTSDFTLAEFKRLQGKMDGSNPNAITPKEYMDGTPNWRTDWYSSTGTLMTHAESIALFQQLGVKMTPELKAPVVDMPFLGFSQEDYTQKIIDEYRNAGVKPSDVYVQSFRLEDIQFWIDKNPDFAQQAVFLDARMYEKTLWKPSVKNMKTLKKQGIQYIAPPMFALVIEKDNQIIPSDYAKYAQEAELQIITWTLERSGTLLNGGGWYYQSIKEVTNNEGDVFNMLHVLAQDVGVKGVFSDWSATTTYYANCFDL